MTVSHSGIECQLAKCLKYKTLKQETSCMITEKEDFHPSRAGVSNSMDVGVGTLVGSTDIKIGSVGKFTLLF